MTTKALLIAALISIIIFTPIGGAILSGIVNLFKSKP